MTAPAEGPATVTPHTDSCRGPRGLNACDCGAEQRAVGPATVTLTDDELEPLRVALMVAYASQPMGYDRAKRATDRTVAEVVAPFAARVDALTADLAAARRREAAAKWRLEVTDARVRAVLDATEWNDWPGRHRLLERIRRALLPAAPTGEEGQ
jgi:hypothetical protein